MEKSNTLTLVLFAIIVGLAGFLYIEKTKPEPIDYDAQVAKLNKEVDSLYSASFTLLYANDSLIEENLHLAFEKDSLKTVILKKKKVVDKHKKKKDENSRIIYSSDGTSIVDILTKHEFDRRQAELKTSGKK